MTEKDYELFSNLVSLTQPQLKKVMSKYLSNKYSKILETDSYIIAVGDIPIALVAHMDTVYRTPVREIYYDKEKQVIWSPEGLGSDDRAGVYAIIKILQSGLRPSVILCCDEEIGGAGAIKCGTDYPDGPPMELKYLIEVDRKGCGECVFYQCASLEFINYIESFGFQFEYGSFSDITFLMDAWKICATNVSAGYLDEHSYSERLFVTWLELTIDKITKMLMERDIPDFYYHESDQVTPCQCEYCGTVVDLSDLVPVKTETGYKECCIDCLTKKNIEWCESCGEPFEPNDTSTTFCNDCRSVIECTKM